jgi:hypothetical protein
MLIREKISCSSNFVLSSNLHSSELFYSRFALDQYVKLFLCLEFSNRASCIRFLKVYVVSNSFSPSKNVVGSQLHISHRCNHGAQECIKPGHLVLEYN